MCSSSRMARSPDPVAIAASDRRAQRAFDVSVALMSHTDVRRNGVLKGT